MSSNAFSQFKNDHAGETTVTNDLNEKAVAGMLKLYQESYDRVFRILQEAKRDASIVTAGMQTELLKQIASQLDGLTEGSGAYLKKAMTDMAELAVRQALNDAGLDPKVKARFHEQYSTQYVERTFKDQYAHIAGQTDKMLGSVKTMLREEATAVFRRASVEGLTRQKAYKALRDQVLARDPSFQFIDKAGRRWSTKSYFEMLTRTVIATTLRENYVDTLTREGHDLVKINVLGSKDACRGWEGQVVSLTGATKGYPNLADAIASGQIFHPRCRHRFFAYYPSEAEEQDIKAQTQAEAASKASEDTGEPATAKAMGEAETAQQAEDQASRANLAGSVSYDGLDVELSNTINRHVSEALDTLPGLKPLTRLSSATSEEIGPFTLGVFRFSPSKAEFELLWNKHKLSGVAFEEGVERMVKSRTNARAWVEQIREELKGTDLSESAKAGLTKDLQGFKERAVGNNFAASETAQGLRESTIHHEIFHWMERSFNLIENPSTEAQKAMMLWDVKNGSKLLKEEAGKVSGYARTDVEEMAAEMYAKYKAGQRVPPEFVDYLKAIQKELSRS